MSADGMAVEEIADLTRRADASVVKDTFIQDVDEVPALAVIKHRQDELIDVLDFEGLGGSPNRPRGGATFYDHQSWATYVFDRKDDRTTLWAEDTATRLTAVFNDHVDGFPGWRDYRATLDLEIDDKWIEWLTGGQTQLHPHRVPKQIMLPHKDFAEFLEEHADDVHKPNGDRTLPDSTRMMTVARDFQVKTTSGTRTSRAVRLDSDTVAVHYEPREEGRGGKKGEVEVPTKFQIKVPIFKRGPAVVIEALFRWAEDRNSGDLYLGYKLMRPLDEQRAGFDAIVAQARTALAGVKEGEEVPAGTILPTVLYGAPPDPVDDHQRRPLVSSTYGANGRY